jgi:hypothetical protein
VIDGGVQPRQLLIALDELITRIRDSLRPAAKGLLSMRLFRKAQMLPLFHQAPDL